MKKILVIDDDQMMLNALTTLLEEENQSIITATDGHTGIELYRKQKPHLVLLDLKLPSITGIDVLKEIRKINREAKVIIITGYPTPEAAEESMRNGAFAFYDKSRDIGELSGAVRKALETK
jgi:sigma-B regulation protein RsbU (phosphoserine phosphatase)